MSNRKSTLRALCVGLTLGLCFTVSGAQETAKGAADYWPFKAGNTWTLLTKIQDKNDPQTKTMSQVITVSKATTKDGKTEAVLEYKAEGKTTQTETYQADAKSLMRIASGVGGGAKISPPFPVVLFPLTDGKKWDWKGTIKINGQDIAGSSHHTIRGPETLKTDAGTFQAMHVHVDLTVTAQGQSQKLVNDYWFAPKVGLVKQKVTLGNQDVEGLVTSYKLKE